jgi:RNA polymerase sigma-70 factor, ECF subfamily
MSDSSTTEGVVGAHAEELALAARAARGDHEAFRQIVLRYEQRLLAFLTHMTGDAELARDLAQDTFGVPRGHAW